MDLRFIDLTFWILACFNLSVDIIFRNLRFIQELITIRIGRLFEVGLNIRKLTFFFHFLLKTLIQNNVSCNKRIFKVSWGLIYYC